MEIISLHNRFKNYCSAFKGNTHRTIQWYEHTLSRFLDFADVTTIDQLSKHLIEDWIIHGQTHWKWSSKTIRNHLTSLSLFVDWCVDEEYIKENPLKKIRRPTLPKKLPKHLSQEEASCLISWAKTFHYTYKFEKSRAIAIVATFIYTGIRLSELQNLKLFDVDLESNVLKVICGKHRKDRIVPITQNLNKILSKYLQDRARLKRCSPYFFTSLRYDEKMGDLVIKRLIEKLRKKSGIYFTPHLLRHTFAVLMLEGGCNLFALSKMMGHSDIATTTIYLSATKTHLQEQIHMHPLNHV